MTGADSITDAMQNAVRNGVFPGAVLLVRSRGTTVYDRAFGSAVLVPHREPATVDTIYDLASLTKPLATTTAILCLIQDGRLTLDAPIERHFPELHSYVLGTALIRHLLNHSSGLPDWRPMSEWLENSGPSYGNGGQRTEALLRHLASEPLLHPIGSRSVYSDLGFVLLGLLVERVAGTSLDRFCRARIFDRIGASPIFFRSATGKAAAADTGFQIAATEHDSRRGRILRGEVHDENARALGGVAGHAGLFGTAKAVSRVVDAWLHAWLGTEELLAPSLVRDFTRRQNLAEGSSWALGWDTPSQPSSSGRYFAPQSFGHLGFTGTSIWVDPVSQLQVVLLSNRIHPTRQNTKIRQFRPLIHDLVYEVYCRERG